MDKLANSMRKVAVLVSSLDMATADALLDQMPAEQAVAVRRMLLEMDEIDPAEQEQVIAEFFGSDDKQAAEASDGVEFGGQLAELFGAPQPQRVASRRAGRAAEVDLPQGQPFQFLESAQSERLVPLLAGERPQTIALVLSHLPPQRAAAVLASLSDQLQAEVMRRLADLDEADPQTLREVERGLESQIREHLHADRRRQAGVAAVAAIIKAAPSRSQRVILDNLEQHQPHLACRIPAGREIEFEDLSSLGEAAMRTLFAASDLEVAALALAAAPPIFAAQVIDHLSPAEAHLLQRRIQNLGPTPLSDLDEAKSQLAAVAQRLVDEGLLEWRGEAAMLESFA